MERHSGTGAMGADVSTGAVHGRDPGRIPLQGDVVLDGRRVALAGVVTQSHQEWVRRRRWRWLPWPTQAVPVVVIEAVRIDRIDVMPDHPLFQRLTAPSPDTDLVERGP